MSTVLVGAGYKAHASDDQGPPRVVNPPVQRQ